MSLKISITGHRRLESPEVVKKQIAVEIQKILDNSEEKDFEAYTSIAAGSDSLFAKIALELNGKLKVVLPFPQTEYLKDFDSNETNIFNDLLLKDDNPVIIIDTPPSTPETRDEAYLQAGEYIVDNCDFLIAVWDGEESKGKGGTAEIVEYAHKLKKPVIHIKQYRSDISRLFHHYDKKAVFYKRIYEWLWKLSILLSLSAALLLAAFISFKLEQYKIELATTEFIFVIFAMCIILYLKWSKLNKSRIASRRAAERLRVLEKFDASCINIELLEHFEDLPLEVTELEEKYESIVYPENSFERSRKSLLYLIDEQLNYHTDKRPEIKGKTFHFLEKIQFPLLIVFFIGVVFHFTAVIIRENEPMSHFLHEIGLLLSLSIPPIYAAIEGYFYFKEYHKIFMDSEKMTIFFKNMEAGINSIDRVSEKKFEALNTYAAQIIKNMDSETKDWGILVEQKKAPGI